MQHPHGSLISSGKSQEAGFKLIEQVDRKPDHMKEMRITLGENLKVNARYKDYLIRTDQPEAAGGDGSHPSPFDLFLVSVGTCAGFYVKSFCRQRGIPEDKIELVQRMEVDKATRMITRVEIDILLPPEFPEKYKESVIKAAGACTVKKHIASAPEFVLNTVTSK